MNWIWPATVTSSPSLLQRAGRLVHWASICIAVLPILFGAIYAVQPNVEGGVWALFGGIAAGLLFALAGRSIRYVLANE